MSEAAASVSGEVPQSFPRHHSKEASTYSTALVATTRLLSALCMGSAMMAVIRFDITTPTGRLIAVPSVLVAFTGQLVAGQASSREPAPWVPAGLALFWAGLIFIATLWAVALA